MSIDSLLQGGYILKSKEELDSALGKGESAQPIALLVGVFKEIHLALFLTSLRFSQAAEITQIILAHNELSTLPGAMFDLPAVVLLNVR